MKLKSMTKEEIDLYTLPDLTEIILKENKKPMNTANIFKKICELLNYSDEDYSNKIGDFYTSLTTDKRFVLLEDAMWDLKDKHVVKIDLDEETDEDELEEETDEEFEDEEDQIMEDEEEIIDDDVDDDLDDLSIIDEDQAQD